MEALTFPDLYVEPGMDTTYIILLPILFLGVIVFLCGLLMFLVVVFDLLIDLFLRLFDAIFG